MYFQLKKANQKERNLHFTISKKFWILVLQMPTSFVLFPHIPDAP